MDPLIESIRSGTDTHTEHETGSKAAHEAVQSMAHEQLTQLSASIDARLTSVDGDSRLTDEQKTAVKNSLSILKLSITNRIQALDAQRIANNPSFGTAAGTVGSTVGGEILNISRGVDTVVRSGSEAMASSPVARYGILAGLMGSAYMVPRFFRKLFTGRWGKETAEQAQKREKDEAEQKAKVLAAGGTYTAPRNGPSTGRSILATLSTVALSIGAFVGLNAIGRNNNTNTPGSGPAV